MICFALLFLVTHGPMVVCWLAPEYPHASLQGYLAVNGDSNNPLNPTDSPLLTATATLCGVVGFGIFTTRVPEVGNTLSALYRQLL